MPFEMEPMIRVRSIERFSLKHYAFASPETLQSLQIFHPTFQPKSRPLGPDSRTHGEGENFSIYGLLHRFIHTNQGRSALSALLRKPLSNIEMIESRQQVIALFLRPQNRQTTHDMSQGLRKVKDMKVCVNLLRKGIECMSAGRKLSGSV